MEMISEATEMGLKDRLFELTKNSFRQNPEVPYSEHIRKNLENIKKEYENDTNS